MLMIFKRESSSDVTVEFPVGEWLAPNPDLENKGTYHNQEGDIKIHKIYTCFAISAYMIHVGLTILFK